VIAHLNSDACETPKPGDSIFARVDRILQYIDQNEGTAGLLINDNTLQKKIAGIEGSVQQIKTSVSNGRGAGLRFADIGQDARKPLDRFNTIMADLGKPGGTLGLFLHDPNSPSLRAEAAETMKEGRGLMDDVSKDKRPAEIMRQVRVTSDKTGSQITKIKSGQGTLGPLLSETQLRDSIKSIDTEFDSFVADFKKHPMHFVQIQLGIY